MNRFQTLIQRASEAESSTTDLVLMGKSVVAHAMRQMVQLAASVDQPLLITGPIGTGKASLAQAIHRASARESEPFTAISSIDIMSEDKSERYSRPEWWHRLAPAGTLYIDEVSLLSQDIQLGLLDLILPSPYGVLALNTVPRVIASTSEHLMAENQQLVLDAELYDELSRLTIPCVPLHKRRDDIIELVERLWSADFDALPPQLSSKAWDMVTHYEWPGNLRELSNFSNRILRIHGGKKVNAEQARMVLQMERRTASIASNSEQSVALQKPDFNLKEHLAQEERLFLAEALARSGGVVQRAADMSGVKRTTFIEKMKRYGLSK